MLTAAITLPLGARTGADTEATPAEGRGWNAVECDWNAQGPLTADQVVRPKVCEKPVICSAAVENAQ